MSEAEAISALATPRVVVIKANISARLNVAFHQNSVPAVAEIELLNDTADDLDGVAISVSAAPGFLQPKIFRFDHIRAGGAQRLNPVPIDFDAKFLLGLTEAVRGEITIVAKAGEAEVARLTMPCQLLSPSEWTGLSTAPELIAAFVRPNDPSVDVVLRNAAEKLRKAGRDAALDGYRSNKKARAWELTEAIWAALCDERIVYALPAQSFERNGQKVRSPTAVLDRKIGTCLDLALKLVSLEDALDGCERILRDEFKDFPESALYMIGAIDETKGKARFGPPAVPAAPESKTEGEADPNPAAQSPGKTTPESHPHQGTRPQSKVEHARNTHDS
jgi:hypothetical protein